MTELPGVLLVSEEPDKTDALQNMLKECGYQIKSHVTVQDDVIEEVDRSQPDVIVVQTETTSHFFMNQLYNLNQENPRPIVIFTDKSESGLIDSAIKAGVSAYVVDGLVSERVKPVIELAIARFKEMQSLYKELSETKSNLEESSQSE